MKKNILITVIILLLLAAYGTYRLGNRRIIIIVEGTPAASQQIRLRSTGEVLDLDESGSLKLDWGLKKQENPGFFFQSSPQALWILRLPDRGTATFNITGPNVVTDLERSYGLFKMKRQVTQTYTPQDPKTQKIPPESILATKAAAEAAAAKAAADPEPE